MGAKNKALEIKLDNQTKWILPLALGCISCTLNWLLIDVDNDSYIWNCSQTSFYQRLEALFTIIIGSYIGTYIAKLNICHFVGKKKPAKEYTILILISLTTINLGLLFVSYFINKRPPFVKDVLVCHIINLSMTMVGYFYLRSIIYNTFYTQQSLQVEKINSQQYSTELDYLKAQYHPHFLFNALNTVYFKINENNIKAKHTVELLSNLLRYQIYDIKNLVTLEQEIEHIKDFIEFQKMRKNEHLSFNINIDAPMPEEQLHPLLFQPLIENAFIYSHGENTNISCSISQTPNAIKFTVQNSINPSEHNANDNSDVGTENLRRRLDLLYPQAHKLEVEHTSAMYKATLAIQTTAKL